MCVLPCFFGVCFLTDLFVLIPCAHSVFPLRLKMSGYEEEVENRAESPGFSCVSLKSDRSMAPPLDFSNEPGPSHTK